MALTPEQLAELQRLKQMYAPLVEAQRRRDQADANAQKMGIPLLPPMDKKAKGGEVEDDYRSEHTAPSPEFGAPMHDVTRDMYPKDFYGPNGFRIYADYGEPKDRDAYNKVTRVKGKPDEMVYIHRAIPTSVYKEALKKDAPLKHMIRKGDWVAISKDYAKEHGESVLRGDYKIASMRVPAKHVWTNGDSVHEWGYHPVETKSTGGSIPSMDVMRLAIGGQGPRNFLKGTVEKVIHPLKQDVLNEEGLRNLEARTGAENANAYKAEKAGAYAINKWIESNLANYIRKQMGHPNDPVRKYADQRHMEIEAKHAKDLERAQRVADRAQQEPDPHRQQNMLRQSVQMRNQADKERAMALENILHFDPDTLGISEEKAESRRQMMGGEKMAKHPAAEAWENAVDYQFEPNTVEDIKTMPDIYKGMHEPWMDKVDPKTMLYELYGADELGFDHIVDILKQDLAEGRLSPEQLNKVTIEHAVRRASEYNMERKKKMAETALKATEGMPVHKEYPEGYKWIELAPPKELPAGHSVVKDEMSGSFKVVDANGKEAVNRPANNLGHTNVPFHRTEEEAIAEALKHDKRLEEALKYEGDTMGHCVGGYCPDVAEGKTRIFSLRDAKNEPHVTIEVRPETNVEGFSSGQIQLLKSHGKYAEKPSIRQIKGKGNAKPKKDYIPYVQDFVKSGNWSDVGDLQNSELIPLGGGKYGTHEEGKAVYGPRVKKAVDFLSGHPAFKEQHAAKQKRNKDLLNMDYDEQRKLESVYGQPIYPGSHYSAPELLNAIKNPEENIGGLHEYYPSLNRWLEESEKAMKHYGMADGGEVDAEEVFMGKGGKVKELEQYLRDREGEYGLKRLQRAADEIPGLENMYTLDALKRAFGGDNAKALMTMDPALFEKYAVRLFDPNDYDEDEYADESPHGNIHEYIQQLAKIKGGFADVPFLEVGRRKPEYLPSIEGHEGRHRSRALAGKGVKKSLVQLFPTGRMREPMPRRHREDFIEAMKKELGEKRLVTPEGRSLLPADLTAQEHRNLENRNLVASNRPQLPEIYKDGGEVDAESYFFPNKE